MNKMKQNKAITLVALIITIIVLLILAGVVINMTIGNDGIIAKAQSAVDMYKNTTEKEEFEIAKVVEDIDEYVGGNRGKVTLTEEEYQIFKNQTTFSEREKLIGKWINGENIYRKVYIYDQTLNAGSSQPVGQILDSSITNDNIKLINVYGSAINNVNDCIYPLSNSQSNGTTVWGGNYNFRRIEDRC